ncbi:hypothetical protein N2152v2_010337 [Parachlorella kessleri]
MRSRGVEYLDVQPYLERVCESMSVGELLHDESFSLFDSMSAIEIGDPKMDLGARRHQDVGTPEELIAAGHAPIDLSAPQLLNLMDQLMVQEAAWHDGGMLPQTVFTSLYMLQTDRLAGHPVLHAFCLALRSACTVVRDLVINGQVCEDEDFCIYIFGMTLDPPGPAAPEAALQALLEMEGYLKQQVKAGGSSAGSSGNGSGGPSHRKPAKGSPEGVALETTRALLARIRFRRLFHEALQRLSSCSWADIDQACKLCDEALDELQRMKDSCHLGAAAGEAPGFVPDINRRHMGLVPLRQAKASSRVFSAVFVKRLLGREEMVDHFTSLLTGLAGLCRALLAVRTWDDLTAVLVPFAAQPTSPITRSALHLLLSSPLKHAAPAVHAEAPAPSAVGPAGDAAGTSRKAGAAAAHRGKSDGNPTDHPQLQDRSTPLHTHPKQHHRSPGKGSSSSSSRSSGKVQRPKGLGLGPGPGAARVADPQIPPPWCPGADMVCREFGWEPGALPGQDVAMFVEQCSIALQSWCHTMCLNRARQRRRLRRLLEDWRNMFDHGFNADVAPELAAWAAQQGWRWAPLDENGDEVQGPVATWVEREACKTMVAHLMLGFPLDLYQPYEFRAIYWYCDYLLGTQQQTSKFLFSAKPPPGLQQAAAHQGQRQRAGRHGRHSAAQQVAEEALVVEQKKTVEVMSLEIERMMCQGMMKLATGLTLMGCIQEPEAPFNSEEQRYLQRFAAFQLLTRPQPLYHPHFQESMATGGKSGMSPETFLAMAYENFFKAQHGAAALLQSPAARALLPEQVTHLNGVRRVATQNSMALKIMLSAARREAQQQQQQAQQPQQQQTGEQQQQAQQLQAQQPLMQGQQQPEQQQQQQQEQQASEQREQQEAQQPDGEKGGSQLESGPGGLLTGETLQGPAAANGQQPMEAEQDKQPDMQEERERAHATPPAQSGASAAAPTAVAVARATRRPAFAVSWDFKPSMQSGLSMYYPVIALRTAAAAPAAAGPS